MAQTQSEYFQEHAVNDMLPPEKMAAMLELPEGDSTVDATAQSGKPAAGSEGGDAVTTGAQGEEGKDGAAGQPAGDGKPKVDEPDPATLTAENAVIQAKDGVHTIGYDKLLEAREAKKVAEDAADAAKAEAERLRQEVEALKKGAQPPAATTATEGGDGKPAGETADEVDFGDFSDEKIKAGVTALVVKAVAPFKAELAAVKGQLGEAEKEAEVEAAEKHYAAIYKAHPDADSISESKELKGWIEAQPTFARTAYADTLAKGSTNDIIELFTTFKSATGKTGAVDSGAGKPDAAAAAAAAKAALANAEVKPPSSLSEIPAGANAAHDPAMAMLEKSPEQLMAQFHGLKPDEILKRIDKVL